MPRPKYPHMMPLEVPIWDRFLANPPMAFTKIAYDVHVGKGMPVPLDSTPGEVRQIQAITRKRIDAVAWTDSSVWLFEVKPRAGHAAAGALLNYRRLYQREHRPRGVVRLGIVCERMEWDVADYYRDLGIAVFMV